MNRIISNRTITKNKGLYACIFLSALLCFSMKTYCEGIRKPADNPLKETYEKLLLPRIENGEKWGIAYEDLSTDLRFSYNGYSQYQSASVIKVFIMGAVYERVCFPADEADRIEYEEMYDGELKDLLRQMITVSDNEAANALIDVLGSGSTDIGKETVNAFCEAHGFKKTHLGRKFLEPDPLDDNYTSPADCRKILSEIYRGTLVSEEASAQMLELLKGQQLKNKIPAGLPEGYKSANKTGEMPEGYGLGCIENDIAIVFEPDGDAFILTVLSNELAGRNSEAQQTIARAAGMTAAARMDVK